MIKMLAILAVVVLVIIIFGAILAVCTDDEYYEEDAFDYDAWEERKNEVCNQTTGREFYKVHLPGVRKDAPDQ